MQIWDISSMLIMEFYCDKNSSEITLKNFVRKRHHFVGNANFLIIKHLLFKIYNNMESK